MAKLSRENKLRERRLNKQAKKEARKQGSLDGIDLPGRALGPREATETDPADGGQAALEPVGRPLTKAD